MAENSIEWTDATWNPIGNDTPGGGPRAAEREPGPVEGE
jgi:hypothetical protein